MLRYATTQGRWVIVATVLGSGIAALDATVVGIALPAIGRELRTNVAGLQWIVTGYSLTLAGLLLVGGALGDRYGRRRVYLLGVVWFALASLLCGLTPNAPVLVAARALQGIGGALLTPGSLAILQASFAPADRPRAIGAWTGLGGVATALGPFVGGWLISAFSWRWVFFINLPLAVAVVLITTRYVPESRDTAHSGPIDLPGALLVTLGLAGVTFGLIASADRGWTAPVVRAALLAGAAALAAFVAVEARRRDPMLPLELFANRQFTATNAVTFVVYGALGGALFLLPVQLQQVCGYSPLASGVALLPVTALMLLLSATSGRVATRIGPRLQMTIGPLLVGAGLLLFTRIRTGDYLAEVAPGVGLLGLGLATTVAPLTSTALDAAPADRAGLASAVNNAVARAAGLVAVAVLPSLAGITGSGYRQPAVFAAGFRTAMLISAVVCATGGLLAAGTIRRQRRPAAGGAALAHCGLDAPPLLDRRR
jgi:EmrB/QacA subfamily drug resistance transporter